MWGISCSSLYMTLAAGGGGRVPFAPHCYFQIIVPHFCLKPLAWELVPSAYRLLRPLLFISWRFYSWLSLTVSSASLGKVFVVAHWSQWSLQYPSFFDFLFSWDHLFHPMYAIIPQAVPHTWLSIPRITCPWAWILSLTYPVFPAHSFNSWTPLGPSINWFCYLFTISIPLTASLSPLLVWMP